uniref:CARDB domain-containing protein n=1 Tax=Fervidicoccus fontis TaxID=683846 RepID=A0A7J3ZK84_9CREN
MHKLGSRGFALSILFYLLLLLVVPSTAYAQGENEFEVTSVQWQDEAGRIVDVTGGDCAYLAITLRQSNPSNIEVAAGTSRLVLNEPPVAISGITVELEESEWFTVLGDRAQAVPTAVPVGNTFTVRFYVGIKDWVKPGDYPGSLRVSYTLASDGERWYVVNKSETVSFVARITGKPDLKVRLKGDVRPGKTSPVKVIVSNDGDAPVSRLEVSLETQAPLEIEPDVIGVGSLGPGGAVQLEFNVTAPYNYVQPSIPLTVTANYLSPSNVSTTRQWSLSLVATSPPRDYPVINTVLYLEDALEPGGKTRAMLLVENNGYREALDISISMIGQGVSISPASTFLSELAPNETLAIPVAVEAPLSTSNQVVYVDVYLTYTTPLGETVSKRETHALRVGGFLNKPKLLVRIESGSTVLTGRSKLELSVVNIGKAPARDVLLKLVSQPGLAIIGGSTEFISEVKPGEERKLLVELSVAEPGESGMSINVEYSDAWGNTYFDSFTLGIKALKKPETTIKVTPLNSTLEGGRTNLVSLSVRSVNGDASDIWLTAYPSRVPLIGSSKAYISSLREGEEAIVSFSAFVPASLVGETVSVGLEIVFVDERGFPRSESLQVNYMVGGKVQLEPIDIVVMPRNPVVGSEIGLVVTVVNRGTDKAYETLSYIKSIGDFKLISGNKTYIGEVGVGSVLPISYSLLIPNGTKPGTHYIAIEIEYRDSLHRVLRDTLEIPIEVGERTLPQERRLSLTGIALWAVGLVVPVAAFIVWYALRQKGAHRIRGANA